QEILDCTQSLISDDEFKSTNSKKTGYRHIADERGEAEHEHEDVNTQDIAGLAAKKELNDQAKQEETDKCLYAEPESNGVLIKDRSPEAIIDDGPGSKTAKNKQKFKSGWKRGKISFKTIWNKHRLDDLGGRH